MSEEVKKILDRMIKSHELYKDIYDEPMRFVLNKKELNLLLDYITGLQQENKQLKSTLTELEEYIGQEWYCFDNESIEFEVAKDILDKIQKLKEKY